MEVFEHIYLIFNSGLNRVSLFGREKGPTSSLMEAFDFHDSGEAISGGKLVIDVSYFGWHIHSETHDLCGETSCPVSIGHFVVSHSQVLPGFTPPVSHDHSFHSFK